jgi:hypothetical protein
VKLELIPLISPAQLDAAAKTTVNYRAPGA